MKTVSMKKFCVLFAFLFFIAGCPDSETPTETPTERFSLNTSAVNGTVTKSPDLTEYDKGTKVSLTATPVAGYQFLKWESNDRVEYANPLILTMDSLKTVTAVFKKKLPTPANLILPPPRNLEFKSSSSGNLLNWRDTSDSESSFIIERSDADNSNFRIIAILSANTTQFTDASSLKENTTYFYRVAACDSDDIRGSYSNISATTEVTVPSAKISLETERTFSVENEIFFSAIGSIEKSMTMDYYDYHTDIRTAGPNAVNFNLPSVDSLYEWDFGDGVVTGAGGGISVTHTYCRPGTYTVTLKVTHKGNEYTKSTDIIIGGEDYKTGPKPAANLLLNMSFEDTIADLSDNGLSVSWGNGVGEFGRGIEGKAVSLTNGKYLVIDDSRDILGGKNEFTLSFWAKKINISTEARTYIIQKGDMLLQVLYYGDRAVQGRVTSDEGLGSVDDWCNLNNKNWHQFVLVYNGNLDDESLKLYIDGVRNPVRYEVAKGSVTSSSESIYIGSDRNGANSPDMLIDELRIFDKAISKDEISTGFELHHAEFHARIAQYIYGIIPGIYTKNASNRLQAVITGGDLTEERMIIDKSSLQLKEKFLLENYKLPGSEKDYALKVRILSADGTLLEEKTEYFYKPYDGIPATGIDENNSFRNKVDDPSYPRGKLFFPVTTCGLNNINVEQNLWGYQPPGNTPFTAPVTDYVNAVFSEGFYPTRRSLESWETYLDLCDSDKNQNIDETLKAMGPNDWPGLSYIYSYQSPDDEHPEGEVSRTRRYQNSDVTKMGEYVKTFKNHPSMMIWNWCDEPNFQTPPVIAPTLRSWTYTCHQRDPEHPVMLAFMGWQWRAEGTVDERRAYEYCHNAKTFGQNIHPNYGTQVADLMAIDFYPSFEQEENAFADNARIMGNLQSETGNLIPLMSFIETPPNNKPNWSAPTPEMLKMNIWQNIIHGSKAIGWFHYFERTSKENFDTMAEFMVWLEDLTPVILGPESDLDVSINYGSQTARIDTMVREYDGKIYIFASRQNELVIGESPVPPLPAQNYDVTVTLSIDGVTMSSAKAYKETDLVTISGGGIEDTFKPYDVHIYVIEKQGK
ncbi:MAG: PKD domain-containing protein [Desulfobacterales bacterium]|nr:PKD domain-containing protein [Desulfobacterales bacterium]